METLQEILNNFRNTRIDFTTVFDRIENQLSEITEVVINRQSAFEREEREFREQAAAFEHEKHILLNENARYKRASEVNATGAQTIELNVGGKYFETNLSTLTAKPGSMLSAMFSFNHTLAKGKKIKFRQPELGISLD